MEKPIFTNRKEEPLVSVVIPCYNHQKYIQQSVLSVINQTYTHIELIVIDDGSSDESGLIIRELAERYCFQYELRGNMGLTKTLNYAIKKYAHGDYVCVLASDDYWPLNKIALQVNALRSDVYVGAVYGKALMFYTVPSKNHEIGKILSGNLFKRLLRGNFIPAVTLMFKKDIFVKLGGYDESLIVEDWDLILRIAHKYPIIGIDEVLGYYRAHDFNTATNYKKMRNQELLIMHKWKHETSYAKQILRRYLFYYYIIFATKVKRFLNK